MNIVYLKANDVKSKRIIELKFAGHEKYNGKTFIALKAYCQHRQENRIFRVDRILKMEIVRHK